MAIENGVPDDQSLTEFVFDDVSNSFEAVLARTKVMKRADQWELVLLKSMRTM